MALPTNIRDKIKENLWNQADKMNWSDMNIYDKSIQYKNWGQDAEIGEVLSRYMPYQSVHKYIKDSLMKPYAKSKKLTHENVLKIFGLENISASDFYNKPLGVRLIDGRIVCWGRAVDWKIVLLAIFERSKEDISYSPFCALLTNSNGKYASEKFQDLATDASKKLGLKEINFML